MIALHHRKDQKIFVFGLGLSGISSVNALLKGEATVYAWDDSPEMRASSDLGDKIIKDPRSIDFSDIDALILSPGIPLNYPNPHWIVEIANKNKVSIIGDIQLFLDEILISKVPVKMIFVTGTNGKSTTVSIIYHLLKFMKEDVQLGGNIGINGVLELEYPKKNSIYVIEISSFQIELTPRLKPDIAVLLNISPDHLDRHGDIKNYSMIKSRIFLLQDNDDTAIIGADDKNTIRISNGIRKEINTIRISKNKEVRNGIWGLDGSIITNLDKKKLTMGKLSHKKSLAGEHNLQNIVASIAVLRSLGYSLDDYEAGFHSYLGLKYRMEVIGYYKNICFVNDSKATNAEASREAIISCDNIYWILGGLEKDDGINQIKNSFKNIKKAYLIGSSIKSFSKTLLEKSIDYEICSTLDIAIKSSIFDAVKNKFKSTILFSPACASYDQFKNYEQRGSVFNRYIKDYIE
ncbi:MAG: UDP-N-acetylmuramoyl-L-alanine--D-glutamate ligase [Alphaproteobacteria bacterium]|jgi:UDP-N-acetylmuramoylalanine--D-glutamate ligase